MGKIAKKYSITSNYSEDDVKCKFKRVICLLFKYDSFLIEKDVNERSITHKLAEYLQLEFPEYHVDCEYNRMLNINLDNEYVTKKLDLIIKKVPSSDTNAVTVYPDIIVHKRGHNKDNLLVIEVKKYNNKDGGDYDCKKLEAYKRELKYKFSLFCKIYKDMYSTIKNLTFL